MSKTQHASWFVKMVTIAIIMVLVICLTLFWLYRGGMTPAKAAVFKSIALPVARVNHTVVTSTTVFDRLAYLSTTTNKASFSETLSGSIRDEQINQLAKKQSSGATAQLIDAIEKKLSTDHTVPKSLVKSYTSDVILRIAYHSDEQIHAEVYRKAQSFISALANNVDFDEAAKNSGIAELGEHMRPVSDQGYVNKETLLPELAQALSKDSIGHPKIVPTRSGLVIVNPYAWKDETGQIAFEATVVPLPGYESWLNAQLRSYRPTVFIK